jgi:hypothetical protein
MSDIQSVVGMHDTSSSLKVHAKRGSTGRKTNIVSTFRFLEAKILVATQQKSQRLTRAALGERAVAVDFIMAF